MRQGIELRLQAMRLEFKIHLNPHSSAKLATVEALMKLIREDDYIKNTIREFKVLCDSKTEEDVADLDGHQSPPIVIYLERGSDSEESMKIVHWRSQKAI